RIILAPTSIPDCFTTPALAFNLADHFQCPVIIVADLLMSEGNETVNPALLEADFEIDRGEMITAADAHTNGEPYLRYKNTPSGISPRAIPGVPGHLYVSGTDEHDEDGVLLSDEFTNPQKRRMMVEKRARKMQGAINDITPPKLVGPEQADVTLVGWGSTAGVIREAVEKLAGEEGIVANQLAIKWIVPLHAAEIGKILGRSKNVIVIENNQSGQFARYLRSETGFVAHGHIRKYDGEPFMPHHI